MSGLRARPAIPADHRSAHPNLPGVPWWGAVLIAVVACAIGFAFDAGSGGGELTTVFAALYVIGCLAAVLAVRRAGLFTAVIQPPLLLFVLVPSAYFLMHSSDISGVKDILINCGYPLIQRFPLMFFTSAAVLLVGLARWYFGASPARADAEPAQPATREGLAAKLSSFFGAGADPEPKPARRHTVERKAKPAPRGARPAKRAGTPSRSRHSRPPAETEIIEPVAERPRRRRPRPTEQPTAPEPRRRTRASGRDPRGAVPPAERRAGYDRERPQRPQRAQRTERTERPRRPSRYDDYEPLEPHRPAGNGNHHPVSRVRYRGADESDDRGEYRTRRPPPREFDVSRWEYDI
ncbi:DUF6542 domain-containing protein [Mycolicibacterium sp.]|uniref:DUF6542 domain-containing protein n=1 Tax=Mycolicibacterium sp. TaxID=2320850 RepID=UPI003D0E038A